MNHFRLAFELYRETELKHIYTLCLKYCFQVNNYKHGDHAEL
jgi:hypothetical protein